MLERSSFLIQLVVLLSYIPITYLAYRWLREPRKHQRARWELSQIARPDTEEFKEALATAAHRSQEYVIPLTYITLVLAALYAMTHPDIIALGVWRGLLEQNVGVLENLGGETTGVDVLYGRFLFWSWLGAYVYSVERTVRHYLTNDLNPSVYVAATKRFVVAFVVAAMLSIGFAALSNVDIRGNASSLLATDTQLVLIYLVSFVTGLFPERGMRWILATAGKALGGRSVSNQHRNLSDVDGISYWHRGRLEDEGIENVQNLATAHLLSLVVSTPYDVGQIVDWVDQAILLTYATPEQVQALARAGVRRASDVLRAAEKEPRSLAATSGLSEEELQLIRMSLGSAANVKPICRYRGLSNVAGEKAARAEPGVAPSPEVATGGAEAAVASGPLSS